MFGEKNFQVHLKCYFKEVGLVFGGFSFFFPKTFLKVTLLLDFLAAIILEKRHLIEVKV